MSLVPSLSGEFGPLAIILGLAGAVWGVVADRIAARWPAHEDGSIRKVDWRTVVVIGFGLIAMAALPMRFVDTPQRLLFGVYFLGLVLLMATDLDQRDLPNEITLPMIVLGLGALVWGGNSLVSGPTMPPAWVHVVAAVAVPLVIFGFSLLFGEGAFGFGDVKLLVGAGLLLGAVRLVLVGFAGAVLAGVVIVALLLARRITLKSYFPFAPFLISAIVWITMLPHNAG
jgi:leader peptidase (prepilin peptidase)/N-methyltransferase